jgi:hypothetical protein
MSLTEFITEDAALRDTMLPGELHLPSVLEMMSAAN